MRNRGEVWLADLDPQQGTEPGKIRPVLIVQAQPLLDADHPSTLVIPLTTNLIDDAEPLRMRVVAVSELPHDSDLLLDQIRAIDNRRLTKGPIARISKAQMATVGRAIREVLDLMDNTG